MKFKVGDKVICVRNKHHSKHIEIGKEYTVVRVCYHSIILYEQNSYICFSKSNFEKVETIRKIKLRKLKNGIKKRRHSSLH